MWRNEGTARWLRVGLLVAAPLVFSTPTAWAQVFRLGTWEGSLEGVASFTRNDSQTGGQRSHSQDILTEERLNVRNNGAYLFDPRLVNLSVGVSFGFFQDRFSADGDTTTSNGTLWGYDTFATVLADQPFSLNIFATRNQSVDSRELSGRTEATTESRGATLFAQSLYIPSTLTFRQERVDEETRVANVTASRAERRNIVRYEGNRGWVDSELGLLYEFIDQTDEVFPVLNFRSHDAQVNFDLDFGEELNRHWDSRLRFYTRNGIAETTLWTADESLRMDHTDRLRTEYRYAVIRADTSSGANTTNTILASLRYRFLESLTTTASLDGVRQTFPQGERDTVRGLVDWLYTKRLPLGGHLTLGLGGSLQYENDHFNASEASISQELHTAETPFALPIALDNPFVIISSVVVTKVSLGPLPLGCIRPPGPPVPLVAGTDFTLETTGEITQIVPIPCAGTTIGINPGDTIAVGYSFSVLPSHSFITQAWHANLTVDYGWIRAYFLHDESNQSLVSGRDDRFLTDQRSDTVGAELRYDGSLFHTSLLGEGRRLRSTQVNYDSLRGSGFAQFTILPQLTARLTADYVLTEFSGPHRETQAEAARAGLTYGFSTLGSSVLVDASVGFRRLEDTAQPTDQLVDARFLARWLYRKLEVSPSVEFFDRRRGDTTTIEYRAMLRTIRRF